MVVILYLKWLYHDCRKSPSSNKIFIIFLNEVLFEFVQAKELTRFGTHFCDNSMDHLINPIMLRPSVATLRSWICQKGWLTRITEEFTNITNSFTKVFNVSFILFYCICPYRISACISRPRVYGGIFWKRVLMDLITNIYVLV